MKALKEKIRKYLPWIVNVSRALLAVTFLLSGLIKANDPIGTSIKTGEYLRAMGVADIEEISTLLLAIGQTMLETTLGLYLLLGLRRRTISLFSTLFMLIMTALTVWIVIDEPVGDCGCFGDAIVLSNGATLAKNILLLSCALIVMRWYRLQPRLITRSSLTWAATFLPLTAVLALAVQCIYHQPFIDWRPYKIGADMRQLHEFYAYDTNADEDITDSITSSKGLTLILTCPDLDKADQGITGNINEIYDYCNDHNLKFYCITASDEEAQEQWTDYTGAEYSYLEGDHEVLLTMVRANPGLMLLRDGIIQHKWSNWDMPNAEELEEYLK
jgi:triosephosphate isomerase